MNSLQKTLSKTPAFKRVHSDIKRQSLSHALLVTGDSSSCESFMQLISAAALCKEGGCFTCNICRRVLSGVHPDVMTFPKGEKFNVADIEQLTEDAFVRPFESDIKLLLLRRTEDMNLQSQNKLLKTLEEPPRGVHLLLSCKKPQMLLPTIRSRVNVFDIPAFSTSLIEEFLREEGFKETARAAEISNGSLDLALFYASEKGHKVIEYCIEVLQRLKKTSDIAYYSKEGAALSQSGNAIFAVFCMLLQDILKRQNGMEELIKLPSLKKELICLKNQFTNAAIIEIIENTSEYNRRLVFNANFTMTVDSLLMKILEVK